MKQAVIAHANAMSAPTWHRLAVNDAEISFARTKDPSTCAHIDMNGFHEGASDAFEQAVDALQARRKPAKPHDRIDGPHKGESNDDSLDRTALSSYQARRERIESTGGIMAAFKTGVGEQYASFIDEAAQRRALVADAESQAYAVVCLEESKTSCVSALDIVVHEGANARVTVVFRGSGADRSLPYLLGSHIRAFVGKNARLSLTSVQAAENGWCVVDDAGYVLDEDAVADVKHVSLAHGESYTGLTGDLRADRSAMNVTTRCLARGSAHHDFNYEFAHRGRASKSDLEFNGVLAGESTKTLRATIDFVRGCKKARGHEQESVLIAGEKAHNRSCPVILCGEDDVAGDHGSTIGHIGPEQMFYLASRGIAPDDAEAIFARGVVESALAEADDPVARKAIESIARCPEQEENA